MQGFKRRNKESKNILKRFSNNIGNITIPDLNRIWDIFQHSKKCMLKYDRLDRNT